MYGCAEYRQASTNDKTMKTKNYNIQMLNCPCFNKTLCHIQRKFIPIFFLAVM